MWLLNQDQWEKIDDILGKGLPVVLLLVLVYLYISLFDTSVPTLYKTVLTYVIVGFFSIELIVKFQFYESNKKFLKKEWLNILLVIPFLKVFKLFKLAGIVGKLAKSVKLIPYIQKGVKIPKVIKKLRKK